MIFEIAVGIALGLMIFVHWREILSLGVLVLIFVVLVALLGVTCWLLYEGLQAVKSTPPLFAPDSAIAIGLSLIFSLLLNVLFAFACGQVLEARSSLRGREAYVLGAIFYVLFLASAISLEVGIKSYLDGQTRPALLLFVLLGVSWIFAVHQSLRRNRKRKQNDALPA